MNKALLKDISKQISSGLTPLRSNPVYWESQDIPWVKTEQLGIKHIFDSNEKISKKALKETSLKLNPINSLSIAMYGEGQTRGRISIFKSEMTTNQAYCNVVIDEDKANYEYIYYFLKTQYQELRNLSSGVRENLNSNDIKNFEVRLPGELKTQINIAKILSDLDKKIELNNKINTELEAMAKLIYDYWFVQFDFPDVKGKPYKSSGGKMVYNEALKRDIPDEWMDKELEEVLTVVRGASPRPIKDFISDTGLPWIKISDATKTESRFILKTKQFIKLEGEACTRVLQSDTLILSNSATPAIPRIVKIKSGVHDGWLVINRLKYSLTNEFMYHYFKHERARIVHLGSGSIFKNLKTDYVKSLKIVLPPENLLNQISPKLKLISESIYLRSKENNKLVELRDWLLPMLMNGQVTIK